MSAFRAVFGSTVGTKFVMGATGAILAGFVVVHMLGNLQIYLGPEVLNAYAASLREMPLLLWAARLVLLVAVLLHIASAVRLRRLEGAARPQPYELWAPQATTYAARTMFFGGLALAGFILYHLAHFTFGLTHPEHFSLHDAQGRHDVYGMVVLGFRQPLVSFLYIAAMIPLALHLRHGVSSIFQSFGLNHPKFQWIFRGLGPAIALIVFLGNVSIPLAVLAGWIPYPVGGR
jgi:succinate dehydrogenase / fumarate reductase cytochrome b subunit